MLKRWLVLLTAALAACTILAPAAGAATGSDAPAPAVPDNLSSPMYGDYASRVMLPPEPDGTQHVDIPATIDKLVQAHITTYAYLVYRDSQVRWDDLPAFADAAADAGITLLVYLVPPSESSASTSVPTAERTPDYPPYQWDYHAWAVAIANLAAQHTNIRGIVMDDFRGNTAEVGSAYQFAFTVAYVKSMMDAARAVAPWLTFSPIAYYSDYFANNAIAAMYRPVIDGVVFPYRAESTGNINTHDASAALSEGRELSDLVKCQDGSHCVQLGFPTHADIAVGESATISQPAAVTGSGDQTLSYALNYDNVSQCRTGSGCARISFPAGTHSSPGQYGEVSQQISVTPGADHQLSVWVSDDYQKIVTGGYHFMQVLVDGQVVAERDVADPPTTGWTQLTADLNTVLAGKTTATVALRFYDKKGVSNFGVSAYFDDLSITGATIADPGFDAATMDAWQTSSNAPAFVASHAADAYVVDAMVDGNVVGTYPVSGDRGWRTVSVNVPATLLDKPDVTVSLRLRAASAVTNQHVAVWIDDVRLTGVSLADSGFEQAGPSPWQLATDGGHAQANIVKSLQFIMMTYAARLAAEGRVDPGYQVSPEYIAEVVNDAMQLSDEGYADGSLIYVLNIGDAAGNNPPEYDLVSSIYGSHQAAHPATACDHIVSGAHAGSLTVSSGTTCLEAATVAGSAVVKPGARLVVDASDIGGALAADNAAEVDVCGSHVHGAIAIHGSGSVVVGAPNRSCAPNLLDGSAVIGGTTGSATAVGNITGGSVVLQQNTGGTAVSANSVAGSLVCNANTPAPTDNGTTNNAAGGVTGQCRGL